MKITCDVIQDLLPLYVDEAVSEDSRVPVWEPLKMWKLAGRMLRKPQRLF